MCLSKDDFLTDIYNRYAQQLEYFCLQYVHYQSEYRSLIDDCIQKTFETATQKYEMLSQCSYVEAWLFKTCYNRMTTAIRTYRRRKKHRVSLEDETTFVLPQEAIAASIDELVSRISNQELLDRIIAALNEREREVVHRHLILGESLDNIAKEKDSSVGAIKAILARSRAKARKIRDKDLLLFLMFFVSFLQVVRLKK